MLALSTYPGYTGPITSTLQLPLPSDEHMHTLLCRYGGALSSFTINMFTAPGWYPLYAAIGIHLQ